MKESIKHELRSVILRKYSSFKRTTKEVNWVLRIMEILKNVKAFTP